MERETAALPSPEALEKREEEEDAAVTARAEIHWDETSSDRDDSEEELEMTEDEDGVRLGGGSGLCWLYSPTN